MPRIRYTFLTDLDSELYLVLEEFENAHVHTQIHVLILIVR
jgi:hypothetical protein